MDKRCILHSFAPVAILSVLICAPGGLTTTAFAQGSSLASFTYQGRLNDAGGPATGIYDMRFEIYDLATGGSAVSGVITNAATGVSNGLFTVKLDFGAGVFAGAERWLEIGVRTNGGGSFVTLAPRQQITSAPYAIKSAAADLATTAYSVPGVRGNTNLASTAFGLNTTASGNTSTAMGFQTTASGPSSTAMGQNTVASGDSATAMGSATTASGTYATAMGYLTRATGFVSTAMGANAHANHDHTFVWADGATPAVFASTSNHQFLVRAQGGVGINTNRPQAALHVAGSFARVDGASNEMAYIGGDGAGFDVQVGSFNTNIHALALWNAGYGDYMTLFAKGANFSGPVTLFTTNPNTAALAVQGTLAVDGQIRGGNTGNIISNGVVGGFIGGGGAPGFVNQVGGNYASVVGGVNNTASGEFSTVSGGRFNTATMPEATVSGGGFNSALGFASTIGGGGGNNVSGAWSTIAGGRDNSVTNADYATIGGGNANILVSPFSVIAGGQYHRVTNAPWATIGGGYENLIDTNAFAGTIAGGAFNTLRTNAWRGTISGGQANTVGAPEGTVSGGAFNSALGFSATIGGGGGNSASGGWATVAGGRDNAVTNSDYATIGGGIQNRIDPEAFYATIGGGAGNLIHSNAHFATIPGGRYNSATNYAFAAGNRAKANHAGTFVWSDTLDEDFVSSSENQFLIRAGGGVAINTNNPGGAALFVNGNLKVNGQIESAGPVNLSGGGTSVLLISAINDPGNGVTVNSRGGSPANVISNGVMGGFIGGGGNTNFPNRVGGNYASVLGGSGNTAVGLNSTAMGELSLAKGRASVAMGRETTASADYTIAMGYRTTASGLVATAMGDRTTSSGLSSTAMGYLTKATNDNATAMGQGSIAGGWDSTALGTFAVAAANYSVAAGYYPQANHQGTFVWADSTSTTPFASTANNQFLIRATGGVGINTNNPAGAALAVNGNLKVNGQIESVGPLSLSGGGTNVLRIVAINDPGNGITANFQGGSPANVISNGVAGGFIGGGGNTNFPNRIGGNYASVLGGSGNTAVGLNSTAMGEMSLAKGRASVAMGRQATAIGEGAIAMGGFTTASNHYSTAMGRDTTASGFASTAMGRLTQAINDDATAMGLGSIASGWDSVAMGTYTVAGGHYSMAAGYYGQANHQGTFVWADSTSTTPFASTANNQFLIRATGGVGLGTPTPQAPLHLYSANNPTVMRIQSAGAPGFGRVEFVSNPQGDVNEWRPGYIQSTDNGGFTGGLSFVVNGTGAGNKFAEVETMRVVNGRVGIGTTTPSSALQVVGTVTATAFNPPSDRNLKENFTPVNSRDVLEKVSALAISRWNFKGDAATPHVGPMAQDFHAAFGLGTDERHIATVDADGVALAAIQGLNQKVDSENAKLREELKRRDLESAELKSRLEKLERYLNDKVSGSR